ncbi:endogenous retrovirus group K member 24 Gag polyprotein-like [Sarcophilus harrisii]
MLLQNLAYEVLTSRDWKSIVRTCIESRQNLLWISEYSEIFRIQAQQNSQSGVNTPITYDQLTSVGSYADILVQINYPIVAYEQIAAATIKALGFLPGKHNKDEAFTKTAQGPNELFDDFVGCLQTDVIQTIGENAVTDILIRQLAKENANKVCRRIIPGLHKDAPIEEIIRCCATAGTNIFYNQDKMQTSQDLNMGRQGPFWQGTSRETHQCFQCGKVGHLKAQCWHRDRMRIQGGRTRPKTPCSKCSRGFHWASESRLIQGNGMRGPASGPKAKKYLGHDATPIEPLEVQYPDMTNQPGSNLMGERDYTINQTGNNLMGKRDYNRGE